MSAAVDLKTRMRLHELVKTVKDTNEAAMRWALALLEIRNDKLYLCEAKSFEEFCQKKFQWETRHVRHMWERAKAWEGERLIAETTGEPIITTDVSARAESKPASCGSPDANEQISNHFLSRIGASPVAARAAKVIDIPTPAPEPKPELPLIPKDMMGYQIPKDARPFWDRRGEINELMTSISRVKCRIEELMLTKDRDPLYRLMDQDTVMHLQHAHYCLAILLPHAVCLKCQGILSVLPNRFCAACKGTGLMGKEQYKGYPYPEIKAMREKQITK